MGAVRVMSPLDILLLMLQGDIAVGYIAVDAVSLISLLDILLSMLSV